MFNHSNTIAAERLENIKNVLEGLTHNTPMSEINAAQEAKLAMLCALYRLSPQMPMSSKLSLWLYGPDGSGETQATLSQSDIDVMAAKVIDEVRGELEELKSLVATTQTITHKVQLGGGEPKVIEGMTHYVFDDILADVAIRENVYMVGPAGSGKTTIAKQVAEALDLDFYCYGAIKYDHDVVGYVKPDGSYSQTNLYKAFKHGGLVLMDEMDASSSNALLSLNAVLANDFASFPLGNDDEGGMIDKHPDFVVIASANTFGHGASAQYVGRNPMDMATLDRFSNILMGYDEDLERSVAGNDLWVDYVQAARRAVEHHKMRHVISPRASIKGAKMLAAGQAFSKVADKLIWNKGFSATDKQKIMDDIGNDVADQLRVA